MEVKDLTELFESYIENLFCNNIKALITSELINTNMLAYNHILVFIQDKYSTDVKSEYFWANIGRKLKSKAFELGIIYEHNKIRYINTETGDTVDINQIMPSEFKEALKYGIITKEVRTEELKVHKMFDIRDTVVYDEQAYQQYINNKNENKVTDIKERVTAFIQKNIVDIKLGLDEDLNELIEIVLEHLRKNNTIPDFMFDTVSEATKVSLLHLDNKEYDDKRLVNLSNSMYEAYKQDTKTLKDILECILNTIKSILNINNIGSSIEDDFVVIQKAERLLNIIEANNAILNVRGGK